MNSIFLLHGSLTRFRQTASTPRAGTGLGLTIRARFKARTILEPICNSLDEPETVRNMKACSKFFITQWRPGLKSYFQTWIPKILGSTRALSSKMHRNEKMSRKKIRRPKFEVNRGLGFGLFAFNWPIEMSQISMPTPPMPNSHCLVPDRKFPAPNTKLIRQDSSESRGNFGTRIG